MEKNNSELHKQFGERGLRLTTPRKHIIDILSNTTEHFSAEDVYLRVHKNHPAIGLTTVYRTLELLTNWGLAHKFDFGDRRARYELVEDLHKLGHHHHLVCINCKKIIDYLDFVSDETIFLQKAENSLSKKHKFKIHSHVLQFHGTCNNCNSNK